MKVLIIRRINKNSTNKKYDTVVDILLGYDVVFASQH